MFDFDELEEVAPSELVSQIATPPVLADNVRALLAQAAAPRASTRPRESGSTPASSAGKVPNSRVRSTSGNGGGLHIPWVPPVRGAHITVSQKHVDWMAQKLCLGQDMFLLGDPGPHLRQAVLQFAALHGREVEYIGVNRDTSEADLKQRREINDGHLKFHNAGAVEAALHGRILVLDGIEKAERNVLPLLNNLLENREMALEDGSFMMAPGREEEISQADVGRELLAVSRDFIVIAIGLPVPKYHGSPLDPPLRSRFASRTMPSMTASQELDLLEAVSPAVPKELLQRLVRVVGLWRAAGQPSATSAAKGQTKAEVAALAKAPRLPRFPELGLVSVTRLLALFPSIPGAVALHSAFPWTVFRLPEAAQKSLNEMLRLHELMLPGADRRGYSVESVEAVNNTEARVRFELTGQGSVRATCARGCWPLETDVVWKLTPSQRALLAQMLQDHCLGMDLCLTGERGTGKTTIVRAFAKLLGYRTHTLFCFKDMTARDLTQRRSTDERGNTTWHASPLLEAALGGGLAVLDGIHRLPSGALVGILGRLICDRALALADGTRLVPRAQWDKWLAAGKREADLHSEGFRPVHGAFRVIAIAEPPEEKERAWLDDEVLTLFHFVDVPALQPNEQVKLVRTTCGLPEGAMPTIKGLVGYMKALRKASRADPSLAPMLLSTRQLLHAGWRLKQRPQDIAEASRSCLSAYLNFLPPLTREQVLRMFHAAMSECGVNITLGDDKERKELKRKAAVAAERGEQLKELEEPAIRLRFGPNPGIEAAIADKAEELKREAAAEHERKKEEVMAQAKRGLEQGPRGDGKKLRLFESSTEVTIGDVSARKRRPALPELVPSTLFVDIPQHLAALRSIMIDWNLGRHLLLIGNQGVGKNKLADRFLGLLRVEREYIQLHRDTTVQSLTLQPMLRGGVVVFEDSPLVHAVKHGRVLVVDEADKAPLEVVCILKSLAEDGEFTLGDGRTIVRKALGGEHPDLLPMAEGFRMIVLANRPGFPFLGNDFYRESGDVFASHAVENPDIVSEVELLRSYGPSVPKQRIVELLGLFSELRRMVDEGVLAYPYSTRELVRLVQHLEKFPDDDLEDVLSNVFAFDWHDRKLRETLADVLHGFGVGMGSGRPAAFKHGDPNKVLPKNFKAARHYDSGENAEDNGRGENPGDIGVKDYDDAEDQSGKRNAPKAGNWDGRQHIGEGPWDGGSGGTGTAGIGGRAGPYRLDVGQDLVMLTEEEKKEVSEDWHRQARKMADEAYAQRLKELGMTAPSEQEYSNIRSAVSAQISAMRLVLQSHEAKQRERAWQKQQMHGELDETRIVDGIVGSRNIYRRRGDADNVGSQQELPKRIKFVMDISGSMYTFNRIDQRLQRLAEATVFIIESFAGFEQKYTYSMVGHSGTGPEAELLVPWGKPPTKPAEQLALVKRMAAHAQYCHSGDYTLQATDMAIKDVVRKPADEYYVFVVSDADLARYGIEPESWDRILMQDRRVNAYALLISSNTDEAEQIKARLSPGHGYVCDNNDLLAVTFKQILQATMLRNRD